MTRYEALCFAIRRLGVDMRRFQDRSAHKQAIQELFALAASLEPEPQSDPPPPDASIGPQIETAYSHTSGDS